MADAKRGKSVKPPVKKKSTRRSVEQSHDQSATDQQSDAEHVIDWPESINLRRRTFIIEYLKDYNATRAYCVAYPDADRRGAAVSASKLLRDPNIQRIIDEETDRAINARRARLRELVIRSLDETLSSDISQYLDQSGRIDIKRVRAAGGPIQSISVERIETPHGTRERVNITLDSKSKAREHVMRLTGMITDEPQPAGSSVIIMTSPNDTVQVHDNSKQSRKDISADQ
jgi:hypothetical protein